MPRTFALLLLLAALPLGAQEKVHLSMDRDTHAYAFQLRVDQAGNALRDAGASRTGGGAGFAMFLGDDPLRLRLRMDADTWSGKPAYGSIQTAGLTAEAFYEFEAGDAVVPFVSGGPAFQHWILGSAPALGTERVTVNKLAFRAEAGVFIRRRFGVSLGVLTGSLQAGRQATVTYLGLTFR
ncbi:MAG TPA: hypothetical protein VJ570_01675 [Holophagaceae bacterium]|nr:hypothetical protein [Holophagaceae bacterium]